MHLSPRHCVLFEDETDLLLFPPLQAAWVPRGQDLPVLLKGWNARRVIFGALQVCTGTRVFAVSPLGYAVSADTISERAMAGLAGAHRRRPVTDIAPGADFRTWPAWAVAAAETVRVAPSAMGRARVAGLKATVRM